MSKIDKEEDYRLCVIGDSFTLGYGDPTCLGWTGRLGARAIQKGYDLTVYNLGIRRNTSHDIAMRWHQESEARLKQHSGKCYLIFSFGVNDSVIESHQQTTRVPFVETCLHFQKILSHAKKQYPLIFVGPPPVADSAQNERIFLLDQTFSQEAKKLEIAYIPIFSELMNQPDWMKEVAQYDGAHPRAKEYEILANWIESSPLWWFQ